MLEQAMEVEAVITSNKQHIETNLKERQVKEKSLQLEIQACILVISEALAAKNCLISSGLYL